MDEDMGLAGGEQCCGERDNEISRSMGRKTKELK